VTQGEEAEGLRGASGGGKKTDANSERQRTASRAKNDRPDFCLMAFLYASCQGGPPKKKHMYMYMSEIFNRKVTKKTELKKKSPIFGRVPHLIFFLRLGVFLVNGSSKTPRKK
jgi:hypothetical protein